MFKVCIRCYTYNHSQYIEDAMNGFVVQETDFPFVAAIVDDASTDNAAQIITRFFDSNFDTDDSSIAFRKETEYGSVFYARHKINLNCYFAIVLLKENHYRKKKKRPYISQWLNDAKYIALCEGDDYWIDSLKLQKQVDYMESNPDCCMSTHAALWETDGIKKQKGCAYKTECDLSTDEVIRNGGYYLATASLLYKSCLDNIFPLWRRKANVGDFPLQILGSIEGILHYFPDTMCVYRYMTNNSFSCKHTVWDEAFLRNKIDWMTTLDKETGGVYSKPIYFNLYHSCYKPLYRSHQISFFSCLMAILKSDRKVYNLESLLSEIKKINKT